MKIKICGMRDPANIAAIAALNPDYMGFIFYDRSPRFAGALPPETLDGLPDSIRRVGVFVDAPMAEILDQSDRYALNLIQLHGSEAPEICAEIRRHLPVIKAFGLAEAADFNRTEAYAGSCDYFLFDTKTPSHGGSGRAFDHALLTLYTGRTPYFLSGGLAPADADRLAAVRDPRCVAIDINSCFETAPGVKDPTLVEPFLKVIQASRGVWHTPLHTLKQLKTNRS
jgi:phosphoribosylanthranilate isomerase